MRRHLLGSLAIVLLAAAPVAAQQEAEKFDLSGLPPRPTTFLEQQIRELANHYAPGDRRSAAMIQRKLAQFYREQGDTARARVATARAELAEGGGRPAEPARPAPEPGPALPAPAPPGEPAARLPRARCLQPPTEPIPGGFDGQYYRMQNAATQYQWTFGANGSYHYAVISSGAGTSTRTGERGTYTVESGTLVLWPCREAGGFVTPGVGGRTTLLGGGSEQKSEPRRVPFRFVGPKPSDGIIIDGARYQWRRW